jgi:hypothetical protein
MKRNWWSWLVCSLLFSLPPSLILAQQQTEVTLAYGSPVASMIDDSNSRHTWLLEVASLDRIMIRVERTSGNLLPELILRDPNGDVVAQSYGVDNTGAGAQIENIGLSRTGIFEVLVQRVDHESGLTAGEYSLEVILLARGEDSPPNSEVIGPVEYNTFVEGRITPEHWLHRYSILAPAADYIQVSTARNAGTLMPEIDIWDTDGNSLRTGYTENTGDYATLTYELPQAGEYTVIVTRARRYDGETFGTYRLTLDLLGAGEGSPMLDEITGTVEYDMPLIGELGDGQWYQDWVLTTVAGDVITVTAKRPLDTAAGSGNLRPEVILLGGSGQELRHGYVDNMGAQAIIERYRLEAPGEYFVRVTRERQQTGPTQGSYVLTVALDGSGPGSSNLAGTAGVVDVEAPVNGDISNAQWADMWDFNVDTEQPVDIRVVRTGGTLIPRIDIQDGNGQSLRTAYSNQTRDSAEINQYRFPTTGVYRIVVLRDGEETGYTYGGYQLSVTLTPQT